MAARLSTPAEVENSKIIGRKLILSVDDEPGVLHSRKMILEAAGYDVVNALSGAQALGIFSTVLVDLVVLDYAMPGVNGGEVAKVFKTRRPELPILMISGRPVENEIFLCVDGFLVKGDSAGSLVRKVEQLLSAPATARLPMEITMGPAGDRSPELWQELAKLASTEQDPETQMALVSEINRLVEKHEKKLKDAGSKLANSEIKRMMAMKESAVNDGSNEANSK